MLEKHSEADQILKIKISVKIAIGLKPLIVFARSLIPNDWVQLGWPLSAPAGAIEYEIFYPPRCHLPVQN